MNLILMRAGFPPVIIRRADRFSFHSNTYSTTLGSYNFNREVYYKHLQTANEGDIRPFIRLNLFHFLNPFSTARMCRFIALCTEKTLEAYLWASQEYTMEVEGEESINLPPNLVEDSIEAVDTAVKR